MPGSGWAITSQLTDQIENTTAGQTLVGSRIYFITGNGNEGSVFVPDNQLSKERIKHLVYNRALLLDEIGAMTSDNA